MCSTAGRVAQGMTGPGAFAGRSWPAPLQHQQRGPAPLVDYEKGTPAWDIGMILTLHSSEAHGAAKNCARVVSLLNTKGKPGAERLTAALATRCTCGKGDSPAERTSLTEGNRHARTSAAAAH